MSVTFPYRAPAIRVDQPLGTFYVTVLPAELLLRVAESDRLKAELNEDGTGYSLSGTQRELQEKRLTQIGNYISRADSSFPNSIILAANYNSELGIDQDEADAIDAEAAEADGLPIEKRLASDVDSWSILEANCGCDQLVIPSGKRLAAIIDGQHRLFAFTKADVQRLDMQLICAVFLDLPKPFQAQLFATINSTQKQVDRSLTFELFGYNIAEDSEEFWTPDKLAVFLTRKLGTESGSPMFGRITVAPKRDIALQQISAQGTWRVSTAVVVDGILRLFSNNPKRDSNAMQTPQMLTRAALEKGAKDKSPLRQVFIHRNDSLIYKMVENYLFACDKVFWTVAKPESYIIKTVGVQALFDVLRKLAASAMLNKDLSVSYFESQLTPAGTLDFSDAPFKVPAGSGRSAIRKAIEQRLPA
jgi:DNA phosphorothioation-associated DGQHR protein 1